MSLLHREVRLTISKGTTYRPLIATPPNRPSSPNAILSLCSGNSLIKECICVIGIARAHCVACEISVKLPKDVWKSRG